MKNRSNIEVIRELAASEGIFTTAQAARYGVERSALSYAAANGILERIDHGAYRLVGAQAMSTDGLAAIWKLTSPQKMAHERMGEAGFDGIVIGGRTAAALHGIGDFEESPYVVYSPKRINSRKDNVRFVTRRVRREDVGFSNGFPVTSPERTIVDLLLDLEEPSLVEDAYRNARDGRFDGRRFENLLREAFGEDKGKKTLLWLEGGRPR